MYLHAKLDKSRYMRNTRQAFFLKHVRSKYRLQWPNIYHLPTDVPIHQIFHTIQAICPEINGPCQAKKCLRTGPKCADSDHPTHGLSIIRAFALFIYSVVSIDSVSGQWLPWSGCASAQSYLGPLYPHNSKASFHLVGSNDGWSVNLVILQWADQDVKVRLLLWVVLLPPFLTHFHQVDSSTITLWTSLFPIAGCLVSFYYYYVL